MRFLKVMAVVAVCLFAFSMLANAGHNQFGVADRHEITFSNPTRIGDTLLPVGDYQVLHVMDGDSHVMVFKQMGVKKPIEVRVKCHLVPLSEKAGDTKKVYIVNAANERVLSKLVFAGDSAQHEF